MEREDVRTALITGASSGIGAAFARQLAAQGHNLILVARRGDRLTALAAELQARHPIAAESLAADLSEPAGVERVEERIAQLEILRPPFGDLRLLVNNAGFGTSGDFVEVALGPQLDMIQVHVLASVRLTRAALPGMISRGEGAIINVASLAAFVALPGNVTYCATKSYLVTFSEALQAELRGTGVQAQALCPGFTVTEFHGRPDLQEFDRSRIPRALWSSADDVVRASLNALKRRQALCVPGFKNQLIFALARTGVIGLLLRTNFALRLLREKRS